MSGEMAESVLRRNPSHDGGNLERILREIAFEYPEKLIAIEQGDVTRIAFHIGLVVSRLGTNITICDIGGGVGMFSIGCAALGMKTVLIDDFKDDVNQTFGRSILELHRSYGVQVIERDVILQGIDLPSGSVDAITSFDAIEHLCHSPKDLFRQCMKVLKPGGLFLLGAPNCVNLRKRITMPIGYGKWSPMEDWYESPIFRGHVREPDMDDLRYIARDLGLVNVEILGRNWLGYNSSNPIIRIATAVSDKFLRLRPSLCSDLYLLGFKA